MTLGREKLIFHSEKVKRSRISNGHIISMPMALPASSSDIKFVIRPSWGCIAILRVMARSVFLLLALAAFSFFCDKPNSNSSAESDHAAINTVLPNEALLESQWSSHTLSMVFQDMMSEGLLKTGDKVLCHGIGKKETLGIDGLDVVYGKDTQQHRFANYNLFDFELSAVKSSFPYFPVAEVDRTLKIGGVFALHLSLDAVTFNLKGLLELMPNFKTMYLRKFDVFGLDTVIAFRKVHPAPNLIEMVPEMANGCPMNEKRRAAMKNLEHILLEPPRDSWIEPNDLYNNIQYLPNILGYPLDSTGYAYIDVGSNSHKSSIGSWFHSHYPMHNRKFDLFAIEVNGSFETEYADQVQIKLFPFGDSIKNESGVQIEQSREELELADWLSKTVNADDYVVMKMDIGGAEFQLVPYLVRTGTLCLVDELFLECHYQTPYKKKHKYRRSYWECLSLYGLLREKGVAVHQWWG